MIYLLLILLLSYLVYIYNRFVKFHQKVKTAWSDIGVYLTKRHELIPNLVEIVKGYMDHEKKTLEEIVRARANDSKSLGEEVHQENSLTKSISKVFVLAESYPELKANDSFHKLHLSLIDIEDDVTDARRYFNAVVRDYNNLRESFPSNLIGSLFNYKSIQYFQTNYTEPVEINLDEI